MRQLLVLNATGNRDANGDFGTHASLGILGYSRAVPRRFELSLKQMF